MRLDLFIKVKNIEDLILSEIDLNTFDFTDVLGSWYQLDIAGSSDMWKLDDGFCISFKGDNICLNKEMSAEQIELALKIMVSHQLNISVCDESEFKGELESYQGTIQVLDTIKQIDGVL